MSEFNLLHKTKAFLKPFAESYFYMQNINYKNTLFLFVFCAFTFYTSNKNRKTPTANIHVSTSKFCGQ